MISAWNRFIYRNNVSNRMNMNINTEGYRSDKTYSSVYHALIVTNIRGYVYPVIYNVFFRQHRRMLYFFACLYKDAAVYDCWRWRGIPMKRLYAPCAARNLSPTASRRNTAVPTAAATPTGTARTIMFVRREKKKPCAPSAA